jgi:hypothetical protein
MFVARRRGKTAQFVSLIEPYREQPTVTGFRQVAAPEGTLAFEIRRGEEHYRLVLADKAGEQTIGDIKTNGRVTLVRDTTP